MMSAPVTNSKLQLDRLQQALQHHRAGRLQEARRLYERVLQKDSRCAEAMHLLGTLFGQQGDQARALEWINKAIAREPGNALYRKNAAVTLVQLGRRVEAIAAYEKALALNPDFLEARIALGGLLTDSGKSQRGNRPAAGSGEAPAGFGRRMGSAGARASARGAAGRSRRMLHEGDCAQPGPEPCLQQPGRALRSGRRGRSGSSPV